MKILIAIFLVCLGMAIFLDVRANHRQWLEKEGNRLRKENQQLLDETYGLRKRHSEVWREKNFWVTEANRRGKK